MIRLIFLLACVLFLEIQPAIAYPIDGYHTTGIRRLLRLHRILEGIIKDREPLIGAQKSIDSISLNLVDIDLDLNNGMPERNRDFQNTIDRFFVGLSPNYSIAVLDMTDPENFRYASRKADHGYQPGSVGKLAVLTGLFCELENIYPDDFSKRQELLKNKTVKGGNWVMTDEHTVPIYFPESDKFIKRQLNPQDEFSLYEWTDHMMSVSNNGAASVVWREALLMRVFQDKYPSITPTQIDSFFTNTSKPSLAELAIQVVNYPLRSIGIEEDEWRLGTFFTRGATAIIPGKGGSIGTPNGMIKFLVALEQGRIVDQASSLEMKRLMYMTDRRIRYAANAALRVAAVYFKSGSLYKCDRVKDPGCGKYMGNVNNFMNSVIIVEHDDGVRYMVALMSNVLGKNSNSDHNQLGGKIDRLVRGI